MKNAISLSAALTIIFSVILTLVKELFEPIHQFLAHLSSNHWLSHSLIDLFLFIFLTGLFLMIKLKKSYEMVLFYALLFGSLIIFLFFVYMSLA